MLTFHRTTDDHTTAFAQSLAHLFGLESSPVIEMLTRGVCLHPFSLSLGYACLWTIYLLQYTCITGCYTVILLLTQYPGLPRLKRPLQHNNVGTLHARANGWPLDGQSLHHEYGVEFLGDGAAGNGCFSRGGWWALVVGGWDDGCWVYFGWDAGRGLALGWV